MIRILLITPYFYPHNGGSQQYAQDLYYQLMRVNPTIKVDVICYNTDHAEKREEYKGFTIYRIPCIQFLPGQFAIPNYFALICLLKKLKQKNKYAFINAHTRFFESSWWTPLVAKYLRTKSVLTDHCANHPVHTSSIVTAFVKAIDKLFVPLISNLYDEITVVSRATSDFAIKLGMKKPVLVYAGVDTSLFKPAQKKLIRKVPHIKNTFGKEIIIISFVGRMIPSKGPQLLLKAVKKLLKNRSNIHVVFVGEGEMYMKLKRTKTKRIHFLGPLEKKEVAQLLSVTDIFVYPSMHHEGLPIAILEAGASGCAVIATAQGGTSEVVIHNRTGKIISADPTEILIALKELIEREDERHRLSREMRKYIKANFDWRTSVDAFQNAVKIFIEKRGA